MKTHTVYFIHPLTSIQSTVHYAVPVQTFLNRNQKMFTEQKQSAVKMELNTSINVL